MPAGVEIDGRSVLQSSIALHEINHATLRSSGIGIECAIRYGDPRVYPSGDIYLGREGKSGKGKLLSDAERGDHDAVLLVAEDFGGAHRRAGWEREHDIAGSQPPGGANAHSLGVAAVETE